MILLKLLAKEEIGKTWFGNPKYSENIVTLEYNIEENSIYYNDSNKEKPIKTGKDLCRSMEIIDSIAKRWDSFKVRWDILENNMVDFMITIAKSENPESACFILLGTRPYPINIFNTRLFNPYNPDMLFLYDYKINVGDKEYPLEDYLDKIAKVMENKNSLNSYYNKL